MVKKTALSEYSRVMAKGKKAIVLREGDQLIGVELIDDSCDILLAAREGKANRFPSASLRAMGRVSSGVRGMRLTGDNEVIGLIAMCPDSPNTVLVVSEKGYGKRTPARCLPPYRTRFYGCKDNQRYRQNR